MNKHMGMIAVACSLFLGCQMAGPAPAEWEGEGMRTSAAASTSTTLPPVQQFPAGWPLPSNSFTHLVKGRCHPDGRFRAVAINAPTGTIVARWVGYDAATSSRFFTVAWGSRVPVLVYTAPVTVETLPHVPGPTGELRAPIFDPCQLVVAGDPTDEPPTNDPMGDEEAQWHRFIALGTDSVEALDPYSNPAP
jgi:hypothetical protein